MRFIDLIKLLLANKDAIIELIELIRQLFGGSLVVGAADCDCPDCPALTAFLAEPEVQTILKSMTTPTEQ